MARKLVSIQRIAGLSPIKGADKIEMAQILGWELVIKKGDFAVGDLCVYFEIDSKLPDRDEFEFVKKRSKLRVRTIKLRGQISQGLAMPLSILNGFYDGPIEEGIEVTEALNVIKYEPPIPASLGGTAKGYFPGFLVKTDETRVQVLQELLTLYKGQVFYVAEKLDGSSVTYYMKDGEFGVCSRNLNLKESDTNTFWQVARAKGIEEKLASLGKNIAIQGELIGEGVQKNKYNLRGHDVRFFNVFDIDKYRYYDFSDFVGTIEGLGLTTVPIISTDFVLTDSIPALVEMARQKSTLNPSVHQEGYVLRPLVEDSYGNDRVSFKAINPDFLLKYE